MFRCVLIDCVYHELCVLADPVLRYLICPDVCSVLILLCSVLLQCSYVYGVLF